MPLDLPPSVTGILDEGRQAYIAVDAKDGPHVTPELHAWSGGRLWFAAATTTLKANALRRRPTAGALVTSSAGTVLLHGEVDVVDPRDAASVVRTLAGGPAAAVAMARYGLRNAPDLVAFGRDLATGRLGRRLPPLRAVYALRPLSAAVVVNDRVAEAWGTWDGLARTDADHVVPAGGVQAVVAFPGPIAVPGRWFGDEERVHVPPPILDLLGLPDEFPLSVVTDAYRAPGPAAKRGVLVRGRGRRAADPGYVEIAAARVVTWDGVRTDSAPAG